MGYTYDENARTPGARLAVLFIAFSLFVILAAILLGWRYAQRETTPRELRAFGNTHQQYSAVTSNKT